MDVWNLHISLHRTKFAYIEMLLLLCLVPCEVFAQNKSVANVNHTSSCPSGLQCFSSVRNVTVELGYNGQVCPGNTPQDCYGENDPRGFLRGPRQYPAILYQGDGLIVKSLAKYNFRVKLYNVSKSGFDSCNFQNASPVMPSLTREPFMIPDIFIETTGIKYFIAETDNMIIKCEFGLKLEVNVRSKDKCEPTPSNNGVCSSKGLCAVDGKFFTFNASCVCDTGYQGLYCGERNSCHAALNPCQHGATCTDKISGLVDDYDCHCVTGYEGKNCEQDIKECEPDPCQNGAICLEKLNDYQCLCQPGYYGKNCSSLSDDKCELKPCKNGGTCKRAGENRLNYTCTCPNAFTGRNCTENVTISSSAVAYISVMTTAVVGKSSVVSDVQTSTLGTTYTSTILQTVPYSSALAGEFSTSYGTSSSDALEPMSTMSQSLVTPLPLSSPYLSLSSAFTLRLAPSMTMTVSVSLSTNQSITPSSSSSLVTEKTSEVSSLSSSLTSSSFSTKSLSLSNTALSVSTVEVNRTSSIYDSLINTTSLMLSAAPTSVPSSVISVTTTTPSFTTMVASASSLLEVGPSVTATRVTSSDAASSSLLQTSSMSPLSSSVQPSLSSVASSSSLVPSSSSSVLALLPSSSSSMASSSLSSVPSSSSSVPSSSSSVLALLPSTSSMASSSLSSVQSSSSVLASLPSTSSVVTSSLSSSSSSSMLLSPSSSLPLSTSAGPTVSSSSEVVPPSTFPSSQIIPSTPVSSTMMSSSIYPTMTPPTTMPPLKEQTCQHKPCNNGTCLDVQDAVYGLNFTCRCPKPTYGPRCSTDFTLHFPRFSSSSYLVLKPIAFSARFNKIVITFKTTAANSLLFYSTNSKYKDFIQLYITGGKLEYRFDPGDYLCVITSKVSVNTGNIVTAVVTYDSRNKQGSLQVDNNPRQDKTSLGKMVGIGLYDDWYVGGLPPGKRIGSNDGGQATPALVGCIKDIELNGNQIKFTEANNWNDISECDTPCKGTHQPCQNNGKCIEDPEDPHAYECNCTAGFEGKHCNSPSVCSGDPCKGGVCIMDKSATNTSRVCLCPFGRGGIDCQDEFPIRTPIFSMAYNYSSFIQYQVPTLSGPYFEISLQFKIEPNTSAWNNALMMFSGQNEYLGKGDDFIALGINNSKVLLQYNLGSGIAYIESDPINITHQWHTLTAGRNGKDGYLYLDNQGVKRGSSPGQLIGLNLFTPLYIGGVPDLSELPTDVFFKRGFEGSIVNGGVKFGVTQPLIQLLTSQGNAGSGSQWTVVAGLNVRDENYNGCNTSQPCQNGGTCTQKGAAIACSCVDGWQGMYCVSRQIPCVNYNPCAINSTCREVNNKAVCDCPLGKTGATCSDAISIQRPQFKDNSYMAFTRTALNIRSNANIVIKFIPYNENGLLFYVAHKITTQKGDFLSVSLNNGYVQYRYDLGSGVDPKQSLRNITMNTEHTVTITRDQQAGTLKVDNEAVISVRSPGSAVALDASSNLYVGGVPQLSLVNPSAVADVKSLKDFVGCVTSLMVNGVALKLTETGAAGGRNVDNCQAPNASDSNLA